MSSASSLVCRLSAHEPARQSWNRSSARVTMGECLGERCTHWALAGSWGPRALGCCTELSVRPQNLIFCSECAAIRPPDATFAWRTDRYH